MKVCDLLERRAFSQITYMSLQTWSEVNMSALLPMLFYESDSTHLILENI